MKASPFRVCGNFQTKESRSSSQNMLSEDIEAKSERISQQNWKCFPPRSRKIIWGGEYEQMLFFVSLRNTGLLNYYNSDKN